MMPYMYPTPSPVFPIYLAANPTHIEVVVDDDDDDDHNDNYIEDDYRSSPMTRPMSSIPMTALSQMVNVDRQIPLSASSFNDEQGTFRLRMNVEGFQPSDLNVSIQHGRLIVRGKHIVRGQIPTAHRLRTSSNIAEDDDDTEPDFIAKEFKRTFAIPPNTDVGKAHAQFYPQQQLLVVEIPFQNLSMSSQTRTNPSRIRPIDIFFTIVTILFMDRAVRTTYEQFMLNENRSSDTSSRNTD